MIESDRNRLHDRLSEADIRPSMQRLVILEYMNSCYCHPTADEVYSELVKEHPTLSRTTVFSSLKLLSEKGLLNNIDISSDSTRYDAADRPPHGHFMCRECHRIFDIALDMSTLRLPDDYVCSNVNVFFKGICPECNQNISTTK